MTRDPAGARALQRVLVIGGTRSGKSAVGERVAQRFGGRVVYVATTAAHDPEMADRVAAHQASRSPEWMTLEAPIGVGAALRGFAAPVDTILLDGLTALVSNVLFGVGTDIAETSERAVWPRVETELLALLAVARDRRAHLVVVSDEVGMAVVPPYPAGRLFRDVLGRANQLLAEEATSVYLVVAGIPVDLKRIAESFGSPC